MPLSKSIDLNLIAEKTHQFTGADLKSLCRESAFIAARKSNQEIEMNDFYGAMDLISPTINEDMEIFYSKK
jgi:ATP-dependent 26S proteasome regulatory subunit